MDRIRSLIVLAGLLLIALANITYGGTPVVLSHQGRLLNADDTPVSDGFHPMTFSIWTDSTGGAPIWSELQDVQTHGGLYSCNLGSLQPLGGSILLHGNDNLFLSVTVGGTELLPRMRIGSAARAVMSSSLSASSATGSLSAAAGTDTTKIDASHQSASSIIDSYVHLVDDRALLGLRLYSPGQPHWGNRYTAISKDTVRDYLDMDDDGDGVAERAISQTLAPGTCSVAIKTKGTGADANRVIIVSPDSTLDSSSVGNSSGESVINNMRTRVNDLESRLQAFGLLARSSSSTLSVTPTSCGVAINTKGTGAAKGRTASSSTNDSTATHLLDADDDGDGVAERTIWEKVDNTDAVQEASVDVNHDGTPDVGTGSQTSSERSILKSFFERGDKPTQSQFSALIDSKSASTAVSVDLNHDGQPEGECKTASEETRTYLKEKFQNGDIPTEDNFIADTVDGHTASSNMLVFGAANGRSSSSSVCTADSASTEVSLSFSPPGTLTPALMKAKEKANRTKCSSNLRATNGSNSAESDVSCDSAGAATMQLSSTKSGGSSVFNLMNGDGTVMQLSRSSSSSSATATLSVDDLGSSLELTDPTGTPTVVVTKQGNIGINEPLPDAPIHHSSGARLTSAGDWVNASSRDLKENFQPVDGEQILEKIEQLPISEWNYKAESEDVKHIGPTAQDFKAAFGVGDNDKTISTIDPSGIALAAIKQLKKENNDLKQQVDELKKMVEELAKKK